MKDKMEERKEILLKLDKAILKGKEEIITEIEDKEILDFLARIGWKQIEKDKFMRIICLKGVKTQADLENL